jgi:hypothetical protein
LQENDYGGVLGSDGGTGIVSPNIRGTGKALEGKDPQLGGLQEPKLRVELFYDPADSVSGICMDNVPL